MKKYISILLIVSLFLIINANYAQSGKIGAKVPIVDKNNELQSFFNSLKEAKTKKIRIAHYGDSIIWGDVFTSDIRELLQNKFGGSGAGFVSICTDDIKLKQTTVQTYSDTWSWGSLFTRNENRYPMGIAATVSVPKEKSWVKYSASNFLKSSSSFKDINLFYQSKESLSIKYKTNSGSGNLTLPSTSGKAKSVAIPNSTVVKELELEFPKAAESYFFGVTLDDGNGVYVDNFPLRGNNGSSLLKIDKSMYTDIASDLDYRLVILNFGANAASDDINDKWYKRKMIKVIEHLKESMPKASILLVSLGDKAIKKGSKFETDPAVIKLVKLQEEIASESGVAFWNMYEAMGGKNSSVEWVNANPRLLSYDYVHFNEDGAKVISELFVDALLSKMN